METTQQIISAVYTLLRRPSELKLHPDDVKDLVNDELRGRIQDLDLVGREQRTRSREVHIDMDETDYRVHLSGVPDFEPVGLEYSALAFAGTEYWAEATLVNIRSWTSQYNIADNRVLGAFYGSLTLREGSYLRLNLDPQAVGDYRWRLTYREPLVRIVQEGERPPIPTNFLPIIKIAAALKAIPILQDNSKEWKAWVQNTVPIYTADLLRWEERWRVYLETSAEPPTQPMKSFNSFRRFLRRSTRGYLPRQCG